jgi:hypothetical protein
VKVSCEQCGKPFEAQTRAATFCGPTCRKRASRAPSVPEPLTSVPDVEIVEHPLIAATRRELAEAGQLDTTAGQQALRLAEKLASPFDTGSAAAAASKELSRVMAEALADAAKKSDSLDELAARRMQRASGA